MDVQVKSEHFVEREVFDDEALAGSNDYHRDIKTKNIDDLHTCKNAATYGESSGLHNTPEKSGQEFVIQEDVNVKLEVLHEEIDIKDEFVADATEKGFCQQAQIKYRPGIENSSENQVSDENFSGIGILRTRIKDQTGQTLLDCKICNKIFTFATSAGVNIHKMIHTGEKPFDCKVCFKKFTQLGTLNNHMRIHTGEKYACKICNKTFTASCSVNVHMKTHTGEKPFTCKICNKSFVYNNQLNIHLRVHTGEKPFECKVCNKKFQQSSSLSTHGKIHTGEKRFECKVCNKKFLRLGGLKNHILIHTGEKPFECKICNKKFRDSSKLNQHMKKHSGENSLNVK